MTPPTAGGRRDDAAGFGRFGARRGGGRVHKGCDFSCYPNEPISSPTYGKVVRLAYPYGDDLRWLGCLIRNSTYEVKIFYLDPHFDVIGSYVQEGEVIGWAQDISKKYPDQGMTPHIHMEVRDGDGHLVDPETLTMEA